MDTPTASNAPSDRGEAYELFAENLTEAVYALASAANIYREHELGGRLPSLAHALKAILSSEEFRIAADVACETYEERLPPAWRNGTIYPAPRILGGA